MLLDKHLAAANDALGLVSVEACRANRLLQLRRIGVGEILRGAVLLEQVFRDLIDPLVGALGREDGGDQELKGVLVIERDAGIGVGGFQDGQDFLGAGGGCGSGGWGGSGSLGRASRHSYSV